jgi:hypothetical protein
MKNVAFGGGPQQTRQPRGSDARDRRDCFQPASPGFFI